MANKITTYSVRNGAFLRTWKFDRKNAVTREEMMMPTDSDYADAVLAVWDAKTQTPADLDRMTMLWSMHGIGRDLRIVIDSGRVLPEWLAESFDI